MAHNRNTAPVGISSAASDKIMATMVLGLRLENRQTALMRDVKPPAEGLKEAYEWFCQNRDAVMRRPYAEYIDANI